MKKFAVLGMMLLATGPVLAQTLVPPANMPAATGSVPNRPATKASPTKATNATTVEARVDQRIMRMHQRLKITAEQQPAWDAFAQAMRDNVTSIEQAYKGRQASIATMSAPDNMRNFAQIEQNRAEGIQKLAASFQTLYDAMSDDQKKTADAMFSRYGDHGPGQRKAPK
jgi:periplasmic protein CpxP/Spy